MFLSALASCAKVDAKHDFERAAQVITERTGSQDVYDPQTEEQIADRVDALIADGLTVDEAVHVALLNNRGFQSAFQQIGVSRADLVQSGLLTNPSVSLMSRFPEGGGRANLTFGFGQQLVDLWQIPIRKKVARDQLESTMLDVAHRAIDLAADVRVRCYQLLALQRGEATLRDSLALLEQSMQLVLRQFEAGTVGRSDVNMAQGKIIDVRLELIALHGDIEVAKANLARMLGLSAYDKDWTLTDALPATLALPEKRELLMLAMSQRVDARQMEFQVKAAEAELHQERLKVFPSIEAGMELERMERRAMPGRKILADTARDSIRGGGLTAPTIQSRAERALERRQMIDAMLGPSVTITLPIWDQNQAQIAKARFKALQKRKDYEDVMDKIANDVEQALVTANRARELVRFLNDEALPQAHGHLETGRRIYEAGQQSFLELIQFQNAVITRDRAYVHAWGDYAVAVAELERAVGGRLSAKPATQPASTRPSRP